MTQRWEGYRTFREEGQRGVQLERRLAATPEEVWQLLVDPEEAATWLTALDIEPHVGGSYTLSFDNGMPTCLGHITVFEPPTRLEFGWYEGEAIESRVRIELHPNDGATVLHLTHTLLHDTDNLQPYAEGWSYHLERLAVRASGGAADGDGGADNERLTVLARSNQSVGRPERNANPLDKGEPCGS